MVLAEDFTMSRTDEVHRLTENVYKVRFNYSIKFPQMPAMILGPCRRTRRGNPPSIPLLLFISQSAFKPPIIS